MFANNTAEHEDGGGDALLSKSDTLLKVGDAEHVDAQGLVELCDGDQAVPIGIGFEYRENLLLGTQMLA